MPVSSVGAVGEANEKAGGGTLPSTWDARYSSKSGGRRQSGQQDTPESSSSAEQRGWHLKLSVAAQFEECLELSWELVGDQEVISKKPSLKDCAVEMVLDRSDPNAAGPFKPAKDAMVKRVEMGSDPGGSVQNMPQARRFLVSVVAMCSGQAMRSPWVRAATLDPANREKDLSNIDPTDLPRLHCNHCPCVGYVPFRFTANSAAKMRCRRCGCMYTSHVVVDALSVLRQREQKIREQLQRDKVDHLPEEAIDWDERECLLWTLTQGEFHPRTSLGEGKKAAEGSKASPGGPEGPAGKKGRVSIITPTTESRRRFHEDLWASFKAQDWQDKELIVVETYTSRSSDFFAKLAKKEKRLTYIKFRRQAGQDWSIGLKRNLGIHLATGEFIAHFDDDDLYAQSYLTTMVSQLEAHAAHAITLSSWYIFNVQTCTWGFCDAIAWGWSNGYDEDHPKVRAWAYGYGFSYVYRRQAALSQPYDDCNMGEDFSFVSHLQRQRCRGDATVALVRDEFGICLHTQHGQNTSETFPIRDVPLDEACDLDVAPLAAVASSHAELRAACAKHGPPRHERPRSFRARTPAGDFWLDCEAGCAVATFRHALRQAWEPAACHEVYAVPPSGAAPEHERDRIAAFLLDIPCLADALDAVEDSKAVQEQRRLLASTKRALDDSDRIGLRVGELWLRPSEGHAAVAHGVGEEATDADEKTFDVAITCQRSDVKRFSDKEGAVTARLAVGATVTNLREALDQNLPATARVLARRGDLGLVQLGETEEVPPEVTITEFKGKRRFYVLFSDNQARLIFGMLRDFLQKPKIQSRLDEMESRQRGFHTLLLQLLVKEVYPSILHRLSLPDDHLGGAPVIMEGLAMHRRFEPPLCTMVTEAHFELAHRWMEVETLNRNADAANFALSTLHQLYERWQREHHSDRPAKEAAAPVPLSEAKGERQGEGDLIGVVEEEELDPWGVG